jgi:DNA polymerase/3'-5' exonuclease PolX
VGGSDAPAVGRSNDAVAAMLQEFADLLAISGGDPFRVRAYGRAARTVAGCEGDVGLLDERELDAMPGIGSHLAAKIAEFCRTGSVDELDALRARVPAGLRTLLSVPGLGPKRARQIYTELGVPSLPELLAALHDQRLRELRGWGVRSEEFLVQAITEARASGARIPLVVALDLAEKLLGELSAVPGVRRHGYAGSLRRMRSTVGDIDLLVAADDPDRIMVAFTALPRVARVVARGPTKSTVLTTHGGARCHQQRSEPRPFPPARRLHRRCRRLVCSRARRSPRRGRRTRRPRCPEVSQHDHSDPGSTRRPVVPSGTADLRAGGRGRADGTAWHGRVRRSDEQPGDPPGPPRHLGVCGAHRGGSAGVPGRSAPTAPDGPGAPPPLGRRGSVGEERPWTTRPTRGAGPR